MYLYPGGVLSCDLCNTFQAEPYVVLHVTHNSGSSTGSILHDRKHRHRLIVLVLKIAVYTPFPFDLSYLYTLLLWSSLLYSIKISNRSTKFSNHEHEYYVNYFYYDIWPEYPIHILELFPIVWWNIIRKFVLYYASLYHLDSKKTGQARKSFVSDSQLYSVKGHA